MWQCPKCSRSFKNTNQNHFCGKVESIDDYIAAEPEEVQPLLKEIRETIRAALPDATEKIAWSMPYYWQGENRVGFAAHKKHRGLFPGEAAVKEFTVRLSEYKANKGTIQLPLNKPIDHKLIADIVQWVSENARGESL
jgi:uncharacterized protein YdhG (YjbR/CyaY superfamily)